MTPGDAIMLHLIRPGQQIAIVLGKITPARDIIAGKSADRIEVSPPTQHDDLGAMFIQVAECNLRPQVQPRSSSMTTSPGSITITKSGWRNWRRTRRPLAYRHNRTGEDNADAHLKRQIMGREVVVAVTKNKLDLGPLEQIFYGEFDGRRRQRVLVKIIGE